VLGVGCGKETGLDLRVGRHAIVDGQPYSGHPSVGELQIGMGGLCTATLIGKKTVLTAAHCIESGSSHTFIAGGGSYKAASVHRHPSYNSGSLQNDIALVLLSQEPPIASTPIATVAPTTGLKVTLIGYGVTSENGSDSGSKRIATTTISQVTSTQLIWTANPGGTCYGDSGGPAFATINGQEVQVGVTSSGDPPCGTTDYDTRVDSYASWISQTAGGDVNKGGTTPPPAPPPAPPSDAQPPAVAITAPASGQTVTASFTVQATITDNVAVTSAELSIDGKLVASLQAAPWSFAIAGQAAGAHTVRLTALDAAGNKGEAMVAVTVQTGSNPDPAPSPNPNPSPNPAPAPGGFGAPCKTASDCAGALCAIDRVSKLQYCTATCAVGGASCPLGATCYPDGSGGAFCGPPATPGPSAPGATPDEEMLVGSCSAAPGVAGAQGFLLPLLLAALLALRRRGLSTNRMGTGHLARR
jgi:hypothetical protein